MWSVDWKESSVKCRVLRVKCGVWKEVSCELSFWRSLMFPFLTLSCKSRLYRVTCHVSCIQCRHVSSRFSLLRFSFFRAGRKVWLCCAPFMFECCKTALHLTAVFSRISCAYLQITWCKRLPPTHTHNAVEMDYIAVGRPDVCLVKQYGLAVSS